MQKSFFSQHLKKTYGLFVCYIAYMKIFFTKFLTLEEEFEHQMRQLNVYTCWYKNTRVSATKLWNFLFNFNMFKIEPTF